MEQGCVEYGPEKKVSGGLFNAKLQIGLSESGDRVQAPLPGAVKRS